MMEDIQDSHILKAYFEPNGMQDCFLSYIEPFYHFLKQSTRFIQKLHED